MEAHSELPQYYEYGKVEQLPADVLMIADKLHEVGEPFIATELQAEAERFERFKRYCRKIAGMA